MEFAIGLLLGLVLGAAIGVEVVYHVHARLEFERVRREVRDGWR